MIARAVGQLLLTALMVQTVPVDGAVLAQRAGATPVPSPLGEIALPPIAARFPVAGTRQIGPRKRDLDSYGVVTSAPSVVVLDAASGIPLFFTAPNDPRPIGSITKLATALVYLDTQPDLTVFSSILAEDRVGGGKDHVPIGDPVTQGDILAAALIASDNTAASALARLSGLSREGFVARMNATAATLGMTRSAFVDPTGLSDHNVATAMDVALLLHAAFARPELSARLGLDEHTVVARSGRTFLLESTNLLLSTPIAPDIAVVAGKTGYIPAAGYCLTALIEHAGDRVFVVALGAQEPVDRFDDVARLARWAFATFTWPRGL